MGTWNTGCRACLPPLGGRRCARFLLEWNRWACRCLQTCTATTIRLLDRLPVSGVPPRHTCGYTPPAGLMVPPRLCYLGLTYYRGTACHWYGGLPLPGRGTPPPPGLPAACHLRPATLPLFQVEEPAPEFCSHHHLRSTASALVTIILDAKPALLICSGMFCIFCLEVHLGCTTCLPAFSLVSAPLPFLHLGFCAGSFCSCHLPACLPAGTYGSACTVHHRLEPFCLPVLELPVHFTVRLLGGTPRCSVPFCRRPHRCLPLSPACSGACSTLHWAGYKLMEVPAGTNAWRLHRAPGAPACLPPPACLPGRVYAALPAATHSLRLPAVCLEWCPGGTACRPASCDLEYDLESLIWRYSLGRGPFLIGIISLRAVGPAVPATSPLPGTLMPACRLSLCQIS